MLLDALYGQMMSLDKLLARARLGVTAGSVDISLASLFETATVLKRAGILSPAVKVRIRRLMLATEKLVQQGNDTQRQLFQQLWANLALE